MIIKSHRVATTASRRRLVDHLLHGDENDHVEVLRGSERDIADFWRDAQMRGAAKALRVWIIAPSEETSREQAFEAIDALAKEFSFDPSRATVVEHMKARVTAAFDRHWHVVVGEVDPVSGRVLSSAHDHARHEFVSRLLEARFGHTFVLGAHTKSVLARMRRDGLDTHADRLSLAYEPVADEGPPQEAFTTQQHQVAKRRGVDLPQVREAVADAWRSSASLESLIAALACMELELSPGDVAGEWVVRRDGTLLGSMRRLVKIRKGAFENRMKELIDGNTGISNALVGADPSHGGPKSAGGNIAVARVRGPARQAVDRGRKLPGSRRPPADSIGRRNRGDTPAPGRTARDYDGTGHREGHAPRDTGGLTAASYFVDAVVGLLPAAESIATPAASAAAAVLDRYEADARRRLAGAPEGPSRDDLDAAKSLAESEQAKLTALNARICAVNREIGPLIRAQQQRRRSIWTRWFPDLTADAELGLLRTRRDELLDQHRFAERPMLKALAAQSRAERKFAASVSEVKSSYGRAMAVARIRIAAIAKARRVLELWPTIAYAGARKMLDVGVRIHKVKGRGWDPGPSTASRSL